MVVVGLTEDDNDNSTCDPLTESDYVAIIWTTAAEFPGMCILTVCMPCWYVHIRICKSMCVHIYICMSVCMYACDEFAWICVFNVHMHTHIWFVYKLHMYVYGTKHVWVCCTVYVLLIKAMGYTYCFFNKTFTKLFLAIVFPTIWMVNFKG